MEEDTNSRVVDESADLPATSEDDDQEEYQPRAEESNEDEDDDDDAEDEDLHHQAFIEQLLGAHGQDNDEGMEDIQVEVQIEGGDNDGAETDAERIARQRRQVMRLLQHTAIGRIFQIAASDDDDDDDDDDEYYEGGDDRINHMWGRRRRRAQPDPNRFPKVPSDQGTELMNSGTFGSNESPTTQATPRNGMQKRKKLATRILDRELAVDGEANLRLNLRLMRQDMIPSSNADMIIHYNHPVYSGQFSDDGNFFFSANKDFKVRMYDTSNPYKWRYYKTVEYPYGQWTLTDASLSPDNKYLAYTSIRSTVCLAPTDPNDLGDPYNLDLADRGNGRANNLGGARFGGSFGIWSIRFSGDGRNLVAGTTGGSIVVYDIESRRTTNRIFGHDEDVNAVCFADSSSPHILYSGSDDTTLKVWDTRSMGDSREAGAFVGHIEGLTYIDSKGDGRYILSNGKDQSMKLWDLRMVMSPSDFTNIRPNRRVESHFDYRWGTYDEDDWYQHPNDNSLVTFRGHRVLRTLIRCHFSPPGSTNSRYVYSGSEDGKVYVWNLDATLAGKIDVFAATKDTRPVHDYMRGYDDDDDDITHSRWKTCVRDASWHPNAPIVVASAWSGYGMSTGTCTVHSWNDGAEEDEAEPKMGLRVDQQLYADPSLYGTGSARRVHGLRAANLRRSGH